MEHNNKNCWNTYIAMIYNNFAVFTYESNIFHKNGRFLGKLDYLYFFRRPSTWAEYNI